ncbi:DMT family transporter [Spirulina subsalsa FACHB-351]|uniref:DMT family transporter n=1 Tax=Spirulina subsalsa FACHB-351 TaxID=234711 RepID=A0ABT3LAZ6_9CYAN|nr:DMT family transporter [Spirulina subsalsa]MCW6038259.1 DMT family transporter [Spirulina subsalsa FACHB-351]
MIYFKLVATAIIWGGTFIAGRIVVQALHPFSAAFCRFALASFCLVLLTYHVEQKLPRVRWSQVIGLVVLGLSGVFAYNTFFFWGLQTTPASRASLIIALNPIAVALASAIFLRYRLSSLQIFGILLSFSGAAFIIAQGNPLHLFREGISTGDLWLFGCVISWCIYSIVGKWVMQDLSPLVATTYACFIGTVALLPLALDTGLWEILPDLNLNHWLSLIYLGLFGSAIGFNWYYEGIRTIGPTRAAIFINLVPVSAIFLGVSLLGETVTPLLIAGGILVLLGVSWTNLG